MTWVRGILISLLITLLGCSVELTACNGLSSPREKQATADSQNSTGDVARGQSKANVGKAAQIAKILRVIENLSEIAQSTSDNSDADPDTGVRKKIYDEVESIKAPDQLVILGRICRSILAGQDAADVAYDKVFNVAFWHCVNLLSQDTSDAGVQALNMLWVYSNTDAGDTKLFKEAIANQKARKTRKPL